MRWSLSNANVPFAVLAMCSALLLVGCQSAMFTPSTLPPEFAAPPPSSGHTVPVSRLGAMPVSETLFAGDTVAVSIASGDEEHMESTIVPVASDGTVTVPLIGKVAVQGKSELAAAQAIRQAGIQKHIYRNPDVMVVVQDRLKHRVTVVGAVSRPGQYDLPAGRSSLASALVAAGGLTENSTPVIEIKKPGSFRPVMADTNRPNNVAPVSHIEHIEPQVVRVSLAEMRTKGRNANQLLPDGAVVTVGEQPERYITVMGLTTNQIMKMPYDREFRILEALARAGGPRYSTWISNKARVIRTDPHSGQAISIQVPLREAQVNPQLNIALASGDIVSVEETIGTFTISTISQLIGIGRTALVGATALP